MKQQRPVSPFAGTAVWYSRFRAPYPSAALDYVRDAFNLSPTTRTMDLGCGPGTIAIPLAAVVAEVIAVDPDPDMIEEGKARADAQSRHNIQWVHASAEESLTEHGSFRVAAMAQSFHWMDRDRVLRQLADAVEDGGGLALINPGKRRPQESWETPQTPSWPSIWARGAATPTRARSRRMSRL